MGRLFQRNDDHNIKSAKLGDNILDDDNDDGVGSDCGDDDDVVGDGGDGGDGGDDNHDDNACQESERGCHQDLQSAGAQSVFISAPTYSFPLIHISYSIVFHIS